MHSLWIVDADSDHRVAALKALSKARKALGNEIEGSYVRTWAALESVMGGGGPALVGIGERAALESVGSALELAGMVVELHEGDSRPALLEDSPAEDQDDGPDYAVRTALSVLAFAQGNPSVAVMYAHTLKRNTGDDEEFYDDVIAVIMDAFPERT